MDIIEIRYVSGNTTTTMKIEADEITTGGNQSNLIYIKKGDDLIAVFNREEIVGVYKVE